MSYLKSVYLAVKKVMKLIALVAVVVGTFSYAMFQGGFVSWFLFYAVTTIFVVMLLYIAIPLGALEVTRSFGQSAAVAGSKMTVTVTIKRKWPFPFLYLVVEDEMDEGLERQLDCSPKMIFYPTVKKELTFQYTIPSLKRGEYAFKGTRLETSDMFGLFQKQKYVAASEDLLVYPDYHHIERWSAYERHDTETRLSAADFVEDVTSVAGAREYVPGDKLTSIDWKVSARANKLMTKEFEEYIGQNFLMVLNERVADYQSDTLEAFEKGIELITSVVMYSHRRQLQYGLWSMGEHVTKFPLDAGADQQQRLVYHLAKVKATRTGDFEARFREESDQIPKGTSFILVTTELSDELLNRVKILLSRRVQVYVCLMVTKVDRDPWEKERFYELKRQGAVTYMISDGNLSDAISTNEGERYETIR
ncbi:DUF58 domain-containing protein [Alteribacter populi]|uniref:DUF58 domain-containing protein n=1 Tax=Alteribacter populi TaxID=2011011 RepID=UPI000BBACC0A|nr:DUF58 domain-containing protein [Alteribacter populi]